MIIPECHRVETARRCGRGHDGLADYHPPEEKSWDERRESWRAREIKMEMSSIKRCKLAGAIARSLARVNSSKSRDLGRVNAAAARRRHHRPRHPCPIEPGTIMSVGYLLSLSSQLSELNHDDNPPQCIKPLLSAPDISHP